MSPFSIKESPHDGGDSWDPTKNPSPIFIHAKVNHVSMKIMFDSGATRSFINKTALNKTTHLPITPNKKSYFMADGHTRFEIIGFVKLCITLDNIITDIVVGVVNSLCTDCILGMDYINKYKVNLDNQQKQIHIYTVNKQVSLPMEFPPTKIKMACRVANFICLNPYEERSIQILSQAATGEMLFAPAYSFLHKRGLIISHSLINIKNHAAWISIYNATAKRCYLYANSIIGVIEPLGPTTSISSILNLNEMVKNDKDQTSSLTTLHEQIIDKLIQHVQDQQQLYDLKNMLKKHHMLFDSSRTTIAETPTPHVICTGDHPPTTSKHYPQTIEKQEATFDIIQQMLKNKQIRPSFSQYSAPILLIKKRDGSYRFIVDYRKLNNITISDNYPLPNLEQAIQMVGGHKYYSKLDLRSGYFQIPIREEDRHKTAFVTVHGLYEFNVLAQGLKNSPPSFQRIMSTILSPCKKFCLVYLDDILIYSDSFHQHVNHLNQVLAILNKHKFQLNALKCELARDTIDYLGHTINLHGITPLKERIEKILAIPQPTTLNQANAFIGAIGWYRKFIQDYTKITAPILAVTNLTKQNRFKFKWDMPQQQAFNQLKNAIISQPLFLTYPDPNGPLILATDASDYCIGGVLYQEIDGIRKNIYFHSQMLPQSQRKWPTIEKEALAIYYCVMRMKLYLLGHEFIIQTDHCPLRDMHKKSSNNRRVDRISLVLQQYNIKEIRHVSGKCNCMADYLTRYPRQVEDDDDFLEVDFGFIPSFNTEHHERQSDTNIKMTPPLISAVTTRAQTKKLNQQTSMNDRTPAAIQSSPLNDQPPIVAGHDFNISFIIKAQNEDKLCQEKMLELKTNSTNCSYILEDDVLYKLIHRGVFTKKLILIPSSMILALLHAYHDMPWSAHFGLRRTYMKLKDKYWWPDMKVTIKNYIQGCFKCQSFNIGRHKAPGLLHPIEPPGGPFQLIGIDYSGPFPPTPQGNRYVLAITDYFTKWIIAIPLSNQTAQTTAEALYEHYICIYGVPMRILSDQGSHFNNELMTAFTTILGCHHIKSTAYHPQTNGAIERFNSTFERQIAKLTDHQLNDWDLHLKSITFAYNTGQHATTKFSPYQLQFGRNPRLPPDTSTNVYEFSKPNDYFQHLKQTLKIYQQHVLHNIKQQQQNYKKYFDTNRRDVHYNIGDYVLKRISTHRSKLTALYSQPMSIIEVMHPTYLIQDVTDQKIYKVHVSQLRPFNSDQSFIH